MGEIFEFPNNNRRENVTKREISNLHISRNVYKKSNKAKFSLNKLVVAGLVIGIGIGVISNIRGGDNLAMPPIVGATAFNDYNNDINTSTEALSTYDIVLVNDSIDSNQFDEVQIELSNDGLKFETAEIGNLELNGTETLISFVNYGGDDPVVIANYNDGNNHADLLALGMAAAFCDDKVSGDDIKRGVNIVSLSMRGPSDIEQAVGDVLQPTVTLAVPYDYQIDTEFTDNILEGLARYNNYFVDGTFFDESYLYRVKPGDGYYSLDKDTVIANDLRSDTMLQMNQMLLKKPLPESFRKSTEVIVTKSEVKSLN